MSTTKTKFLCLFRFPTDAAAEVRRLLRKCRRSTPRGRPGWTKFEKELIPGGPLKPGGAVVRGGNVTDGPYIEAKEVIASYASIETSSLARAIEIIKECPINSVSRRTASRSARLGY